MPAGKPSSKIMFIHWFQNSHQWFLLKKIRVNFFWYHFAIQPKNIWWRLINHNIFFVPFFTFCNLFLLFPEVLTLTKLALRSETTFGKWKPFKNDEKAFLVREIFKFLFWHFGNLGKRLDKKVKINFNTNGITDWETNNYKITIARYLKN